MISGDESREYLKEAKFYRQYGGKIPFLMKSVEGMRDFVVDTIFVENITPDEFLKRLQAKFPDLEADKIPTRKTVSTFRKKVREIEEGTQSKNIALALKDEARIVSALIDFNFFEERMEIYKKSRDTVQTAQDVLDKTIALMLTTSKPSSEVFESVTKLTSALESSSKHLSELDDLALRFGLMPPKQEKNIIFAQQNVTVQGEQEEVMKKLGLKEEDFDDDNYEETLKKVVKHYAGKYTNQGKPTVIEAESDNGGDEDNGEGEKEVVEE